MKTKIYLASSILLMMLTIVPMVSVFATKHVINVQNYSFSPSSITDVQVGDTIRWVWVSGSHTTTSTTIPAGAATWDHPINSTSTFYEYAVTLSGTYNYKCTPHAAMGMVGSFTVNGSVPTLSVTPSNHNVSASAGTTTFSVVSNSGWTASSNSAWCTVTPSGTGNGTITATYSVNTSVNQRVATITITVAGIPSQTCTVTQAGAAATLILMPPNQNVSDGAGSVNFNVTSNTNWTATSNSSWCAVTASGSGNGTITATYTENTSVNQRIATISVTVAGIPSQISTLTQSGAAAILTVSPPNQNVGVMAGTVEFSVNSNTDWTAICDSGWCTVTPSGSGNGTLAATYTENSLNFQRMATIMIAVAGLPVQTVTVTQLGRSVGIKENPANLVSIFPNPSKGIFAISPGSFSGLDIEISVFDQVGKVILKKNFTGDAEYIVDLSSRPAGNYLLKITSKDRSVVKRVIIL